MDDANLYWNGAANLIDDARDITKETDQIDAVAYDRSRLDNLTERADRGDKLG
jgi:hypothetical protein